MTRTMIGLFFASALALTVTAPEANATSLNLALKDSTVEAGLFQKIHVYNGTTYHTACAGGHNWRKRQRADGSWRWVYYSPCVFIWRPWRRHHID